MTAMVRKSTINSVNVGIGRNATTHNTTAALAITGAASWWVSCQTTGN